MITILLNSLFVTGTLFTLSVLAGCARQAVATMRALHAEAAAGIPPLILHSRILAATRAAAHVPPCSPAARAITSLQRADIRCLTARLAA